MCFDTQSSLLAWSLALSIAFYLFNRNQNYDRWNAAFIICFTLIQLLEGGIWETLGESAVVNDLLTRLILIVLVAQPLIQSYFGYKYTQDSTLLGFTAVYLIIMVISLFRVGTSKPGQFSSAPGPSGHLIWSDSKSKNFIGCGMIAMLYLAGLMVPLMFMKDYKWVPLVLIGVGTALYSLWIAGKDEFSSYWCFVSVLYAVTCLFV